ncbi:hypothetical protein PR048_013267 [Dryococelus australis]|uniref:Uncharacterized protein n=1 Tax=Dryococelus australis TaxID=614101 RepID=A0ABQ9HRR9_9NEOP|nr:hypothetical protein PR048_013267 [Dryococelus australis]
MEFIKEQKIKCNSEYEPSLLEVYLSSPEIDHKDVIGMAVDMILAGIDTARVAGKGNGCRRRSSLLDDEVSTASARSLRHAVLRHLNRHVSNRSEQAGTDLEFFCGWEGGEVTT